MTDSLLSIGSFARAAGLSPSALRYYDEIGLLPAAHVDPSSGYRYYDAAQQEVAGLLAELRRWDTPVATMRAVLAADGTERARLLDDVAESGIEAADRRASRLRALAEAARRAPGPGEPVVDVDPWRLADALRRAVAIAGEPPFDAVLLVVTAGRLGCWATDRYRAAGLDVEAVVSPAVATRVLLDGADVPAALDRLAAATAPTVRLGLGAGALVFDGEPLPARAATAFPDLPILVSGFAARPGTRLLRRRSELAGDDAVVLTTVGHTVRLAADLLGGAVATLAGDDVALHVPDEPHSPVLLWSPALPAHRVALMPRR